MKIYKTNNPHRKPEIALSNCCNDNISIVPPCFGDPEIAICKTCSNICEYTWRPLYQEVSKGTFRLIEYKPLKTIKV